MVGAAAWIAVRRAADFAARVAVAAELVVEGHAAGAAVVAARAADCAVLGVARVVQGAEHGVCADAARVVAAGSRAA